MNLRSEAGLTWVEVLVATAIFGVLFLLAVPSNFFSGGCIVKGQETQTLSNMKQLHLATQSMALDGETTGDKSLSWPGDTGGTFTNWSRLIVPSYLGTNDFCKLLSGPGVTVPVREVPKTMSSCAVRVYAVSSNSPADAVFLTTANFTNTPQGGGPLLKTAKPYGSKGFVVFRKGGDGAILLTKQVGDTNLIGSYVPMLK